jgi:hypothetical protein
MVDLLITRAVLLLKVRRSVDGASVVADSSANSTGAVYRDEAADLMAAAARGTLRRPPPELELTARRAAPEIRPERSRPLPYPEPVGINDNDDALDDVRPTRRRGPGALQLLARIVIAPLYLAVAAGAIAVIVLFVRSWLAF